MAAGVVIAAAAAVSLVSSGLSAYSQINAANQAAETQADQIRMQMVQTRLQQNQASISRMKNLEHVLASQEVSFGVKNIAPGSSGQRGLTQESYHNFLDDENADKLNYAAKQMALARQQQLVWMNRKAQVFGAVTGALKEGAGTVMGAYGVPSKSLIDKSAAGGGGAQPSTQGTYGAQRFAANQKSNLNLNA